MKSKAATMQPLGDQDRLRELTKHIQLVQADIAKVVKKGERSNDAAFIRQCTARAKQLVQQLARMTYEAQGLQMQLEQQLLGPMATVALTWTKPYYFHHPELAQWAKVRGAAGGTFVFEALLSGGRGILKELPEFRLMSGWQAATAEQYQQQLEHMLETGEIRWNPAQTEDKADKATSPKVHV